MNHKLSIQQSKFTNPFAHLGFRKKRKKTAKVKVPPLDFSQSYTELIVELAYTSNLTRQVIRPFNRCHLISQLTECARLIRGRIASGAACIQLPLLADCKKNEQRMSDNRMIMVKINQFNEAHALFTDWINKLSSAPFVTNTFSPTVVQPSDEGSPTNQQILLSKSNYSIQNGNLLQDLQCDGELLFCQLQSCALAVFELLKNVGYTTFVEPSCMEASLYKSCYVQNESTPIHLNKNGHEIENNGTEILGHSHCNSCNNTSIKSSSVFTDEDRELLAKLWRYLDPNSSVLGTNSPPPKPPLPNLCPLNIPFSDRRTDLVSSSNQSSQLSTNPFHDPNLLKYLCTIASTAQQKYPSNSSPIKKSSDCQKEFTLPTSRLDLNATDHLSFPLVDESDTSDLESNFNYPNNSNKLKDFCTIQTRSYKPNSSSFSTKDASHPVIEQPKLPIGQKEKADHLDKTSLYSTTCNGNFSHVHPSRIILAPSLPDGMGPDLNRVILSQSDQTNTKSVNNNNNELIRSIDTLSLNNSCNSSSNHINELNYPEFKPQYGKWNISCDDTANEYNDCMDHVDPEEPHFTTADVGPPKPSLPNEKPLISYMFRFGSSDCDNPDDERRLSNRLIDFFRDQWLKEESATGPHERKKVISYIQSYTQPTTNGDFIHKSTCIQHTCTVRMVGGLHGLKAQASRNAEMKLPEIFSDDEFSDKISCNSLTSSSNEITSSLTEEADVSQQLETDLSEFNRRKSQIIITSDETDDEEIREDHIPTVTQEREIYTALPIVEATNELPILSLLKANDYLVWGDRNSLNDISVHAGCIDALIVYITSYGRMSPSYYLFFETFLFMYRSFMTSYELVNRLITRYHYFSHPPRYLSHLKNLSHEVRSKVTRLKQDLNDELLEILRNFEEILSQDEYNSLSRILHITIFRQSQEYLQIHSNSKNTEIINNNMRKSDLFLSNCGRTSVLSDISSDQSMLNRNNETNQYSEYNEKVGFITLPKTKSKRSHALENVDRYSVIESTENNPSSTTNSLPTKRIYLSTSKSSLGLLNFSAKSLAEQLTYLECLNYYKINVFELLDISKLEQGKAPGVAACAHHFTMVSNWATYQILSLTSASDRDKVANRLLDVMEHLYKLQNYSTYLSLLCAFLLVPEALFSRKTLSRLSRVTPYMQPPYFSKYRRDLEAANPPLIPYLGLMLQNLIVLDQGNPLFLKTLPTQLTDKYQPYHGPIINFWRCWKHFLIIYVFVKQEKMDPEKSRYSIRPDLKILQFLGNFENSLPDTELHLLANRLRRSIS
ncbi:putative guanine-nucleotide-exchange-factor [Schistosoma mansoni]|uniref:putative guanine-nucleotide-exchange-factor n=1 Tax=Schistosoma mansoni TaxID=6183 RepID=UPI00022DBF5C|nr:putative guanine-nucleotide-exchange-factor [Schistosoma mansoni]|eukprot:XP_018648884.1 putative guanine-nucleotide-exchange-factor [Schistosoma mansoni]